MKLRDYQAEATLAPFEYFQKGGTGNPVIGLPTGTGKSLVIAGMLTHTCMVAPAYSRSLVLTHVQELVEQNAEKLGLYWPAAPYGIYSAGLKSYNYSDHITFGSVQSVYKCPEKFGFVHIIYVDEAHMISQSETAMYRAVIDHFRKINPALKVIGLTATPYRLGQGMITDDGIFTDMVYDRTDMEGFNWFIDQGFLAPLRTRPTDTVMDTSSVKMQGGEFAQGELQRAVGSEKLTYDILCETMEYAQTRNSWLFFAAGVAHSEMIADMLTGHFGIDAVAVHSKMKPQERRDRIKAYKAGRYRAIISRGILTTGFDDPKTDLIVDMGPTGSPALHVQKNGRGTRPDYNPAFTIDMLQFQDGRLEAIATSHKRDCLVLDFAGNVERCGPINDPIIPKRRGGGGGEAPVRICPTDEFDIHERRGCGNYNHASARVCVWCGFEFPVSTKLSTGASSGEIIRKIVEKIEPVIQDFRVNRVYTRHKSGVRGNPDTMQVSYDCDGGSFREFIAFEHSGWPKKAAHDWWRNRDTTGSQPPETTAEALERVSSLAVPTFITVQTNLEYPKIKGYKYA